MLNAGGQPQSNGICLRRENSSLDCFLFLLTFVKTLKRDYIPIAPLPDAETALRLIDGWIEDYNEIHPHSALKMASPRQFIRAKSN